MNRRSAEQIPQQQTKASTGADAEHIRPPQLPLSEAHLPSTSALNAKITSARAFQLSLLCRKRTRHSVSHPSVRIARKPVLKCARHRVPEQCKHVPRPRHCLRLIPDRARICFEREHKALFAVLDVICGRLVSETKTSVGLDRLDYHAKVQRPKSQAVNLHRRDCSNFNARS